MFIAPFDVETILFPLTSKFPPNCGVVSSTTFAIPVPIAKVNIFGLEPSSAAANTILSPLSVLAKVKLLPDPVAYLNSTVYSIA